MQRRVFFFYYCKLSTSNSISRDHFRKIKHFSSKYVRMSDVYRTFMYTCDHHQQRRPHPINFAARQLREQTVVYNIRALWGGGGN